jgi:uncharacterized repeat protein (TIGR01451 family)
VSSRQTASAPPAAYVERRGGNIGQDRRGKPAADAVNVFANSRKHWKVLTLLTAVMLVARLAAAADEAVPVETELVAEVREGVDIARGREVYRFVPATTLAQGQVIYYTLRIRNPEPVFATNVTVIQRIPVNTAYVARSAAGPAAEISFSIDGGQTFAPAERFAVVADGKTQNLPPERYTHIRWRLRNPLAPGAVALARFRAVFK